MNLLIHIIQFTYDLELDCFDIISTIEKLSDVCILRIRKIIVLLLLLILQFNRASEIFQFLTIFSIPSILSSNPYEHYIECDAH